MLLVGRQGAVRLGIGAAQTGAHAAQVKCCPGDAWAQGPGIRGGRADLRASPGGKAEEAAEADPGEQVGLGHADTRRGSSQFTFGAEDVRATLQQLPWIANRQRLGNCRQVFRAQVDAELVGTLAEEGGDAVTLAHLFGLQLRHAGLNRRETRVGTLHVELVAHTGIPQADGDGARFLLVLQVVQGNAFTQLRATQLAVGVHQFGNHGDLQLVQISLGGLLVGVGGFQVALDATEQVQFPGHVQAEVITLTVNALGGLARDLPLGQVTAGTAGDGRHGVIAGVIADRPCRPQASKGDAQIPVTLQRLGYQLVEGRVLELLPPDAFELGVVILLGIGSGRDIGRLRCLGFVVRAHGTGAQRQYQQARQEYFHTHCCVSSFKALAALRASLRST